ncbi:hypothetical protein [Christiangramia sp. SM2212]|uniref:Uncharacterized protein n=1 Tax=Christiangramia sediminicola TaxID=3073267 RepID=A0ABU1ETC0_9FLAO|nr:hypothetical protein [Christiangramia sp. SM2212]MDR5591227.1 hypothetical protein [Christiangramia sp. SM2212]
MKSSKFILKFFAKFLAILIIFQSCNIYHSANISLEKAAETNRKVRLKTEEGNNLKFKWIADKNGEFYGYTRENSSTSKKLKNLGVIGTSSGKFYSYGLEELNIQKIQAKNYTLSTIGTILTAIVALYTTLYIIVAATFSGGFFEWDDSY